MSRTAEVPTLGAGEAAARHMSWRRTSRRFASPTIFRDRVDDRPPGVSLQPERRLMLALLQDAIRTVLKGPYACRRHVADAAAWFAADDPEWPFSFVNVCETLGLDPSALRRWVDLQGRR